MLRKRAVVNIKDRGLTSDNEWFLGYLVFVLLCVHCQRQRVSNWRKFPDVKKHNTNTSLISDVHTENKYFPQPTFYDFSMQHSARNQSWENIIFISSCFQTTFYDYIIWKMLIVQLRNFVCGNIIVKRKLKLQWRLYNVKVSFYTESFKLETIFLFMSLYVGWRTFILLHIQLIWLKYVQKVESAGVSLFSIFTWQFILNSFIMWFV